MNWMMGCRWSEDGCEDWLGCAAIMLASDTHALLLRCFCRWAYREERDVVVAREREDVNIWTYQHCTHRPHPGYNPCLESVREMHMNG